MGRYMVTGCAGFIGAHLTRSLLLDGHTVEGIDNLDDAYPRALKDHRLRWFFSHPNFRLHVVDAGKLHPYGTRVGEFDAIVHLAGRAGVRQSMTAPREYLSENVAGMIGVLELLRAGVTDRLLYASSSSVYTSPVDPVSLEGWPSYVGRHDDSPRTPYAASKRILEMMADTYSQAYEKGSIGMRFFSVYGEAGRPDSRASVFQYVRQVLEGEPITIYGHSEQRRDFTYVGDVVREIRELLTEPVYHAVLNVGTGAPRRVRDVIGVVEELTGRTARVIYRSDPRTDTALTYSTPLPFAPTSLAEGVQRCIDWYVQNRDWACRVGPDGLTRTTAPTEAL